VSKTARTLRISRATVGRSKKIAGLSPKAKKTAQKLGLDQNQAALLKATKKSTPKGQTKTLQKLANSKQAPRRRSLPPREAKQLKALKRAFADARRFKKAWKHATAAVRQKFIKKVLKPST
jgi:hypothetical protein